MESLEGRILLAAPQLLDPNFVRTVVLLIQHNDAGALGVVLNRPLNKTVKDLWQQVGEAPCENEQPVYLGGPVDGPVMVIHAENLLAELEIVPGVFFAAKKQNLDQLVREPRQCKVFIGHAGWGPGQLEEEIAQGAWENLPVTAEEVFDTSDDLWQRLMQRTKVALLPALLGIKHIPPDPSLN